MNQWTTSLVTGLLILLLAPVSSVIGQEASTFSIGARSWPLYPATLPEEPAVTSPWTAETGMEVILGYFTEQNLWTLIPVTVENGKLRNYKKGLMGKGNQLDADRNDFPTLAQTGLHSEEELARTRTITGVPVANITAAGRPERSSWIGFMGPDEDIIGVLTRDNRLVKRMGLTHPDLARVMFHLWNIIQSHDLRMRVQGKPLKGIDWFIYNGRKIRILDAGSGHGWQESIFNDDNLGLYQLEFRRDLDPEEEAFLRKRYSRLGREKLDQLVRKLTYIHTGEMVAYYIQRYGFYEGDTGYRADPVALALIFGLKSIQELDGAFEGQLHEVLMGNAAGLGSAPAPDTSAERPGSM